jgi:hypothetical protein
MSFALILRRAPKLSPTSERWLPASGRLGGSGKPQSDGSHETPKPLTTR